jgi:hypothetical protein
MPSNSNISRRSFIAICAVAIATVAIGVLADAIEGDDIDPPHTTPVAMSGDYDGQAVNYVLLDFEQPRDGSNVPHAVALGLYYDYDACIAAVMQSDDAFICVPYEF